MTNTNQVAVYSRHNCNFCDALKSYLKEENVDFIEYNIEENDEARNKIISLGVMGVPVAMVGEKYVVGFDKPKINELIGK